MPSAVANTPPVVHHGALQTTFLGIEHPLSTDELPIHQYRGIKYASVPARFRQSHLFSAYDSTTDASKYGPICPQFKSSKTFEEAMFDLELDDTPKQALKQNEFECLNLNITAPAGLSSHARVPVMVWIHGGADRGSGSSWLYDGGALVRHSMLMGKPIILVTFNFRLGLFGFAASIPLREDNKAAGDVGVGNYGLRDQRKALEWIHRFIGDFGGDPNNVTLFGASTGAADVVSHLLSLDNELKPLFHRAIIQSAILEPNLPDVAAAGSHLSRIMGALGVSTVDQLRHLDADRLTAYGQALRAVDDDDFFRPGWQSCFYADDGHHHHHHHLLRNLSPSRASKKVLRPAGLVLPTHLQPLIIGDCGADALVWSLHASMWTSPAVVRRLKAVCQSLTKSMNLLHAYDISSSTDDTEIVDRVLDLINDARVAWPTECVARYAKHERGGRGVWRYVFDQEGATISLPHHGVDLMYLFDNIALPDSGAAITFESGGFYEEEDEYASEVGSDEDMYSMWTQPSVDGCSYAKVRDTMQDKWISFAHGEAPWNEDKVFVFGPEGETGERSQAIFAGRRRAQAWKTAFEPLGMHVVHKIGVELSRGPPLNSRA
ncbi:Alpha/Beta hydrolase protein [Mucidula mucida]|nr:Alpha/Beta hydrolase protein [Mucidula mucida]